MCQKFSNFHFFFKFSNFKISKSILKSAVLPAFLMPLLKTKPNCWIKASLSCDTLESCTAWVAKQNCGLLELQVLPLVHTTRVMLFWEGSCLPSKIHLVWFITYYQDYSERSWGVLETGHHMKKSLKFTEISMLFGSSVGPEI